MIDPRIYDGFGLGYLRCCVVRGFCIRAAYFALLKDILVLFAGLWILRAWLAVSPVDSSADRYAVKTRL